MAKTQQVASRFSSTDRTDSEPARANEPIEGPALSRSKTPVTHTWHDVGWVSLLAQGEGNPWSMFLPFIVIGVLFYMMLIRPQKREQVRVREMQDSLKKNDRVVTTGGICGTVVNVQQDSVYVTIRVDETTNTKLRVVRSSISRVVTDEDDEKGGKSDGS